MKAFATPLLLATAAACAPAPGAAPAPSPQPAADVAPAAVNPVGRFEFSTTLQGQPITGTMEITGTPGAYAGQITSQATEPIPVGGVTVDGQRMVVTAETPNGTLTIRLAFTDARSFTGDWSLGGDTAGLTGHRAP